MKTLTIIGLLALGGPALADKHGSKADQLFDQGKKMMAEKRYAEACAAFEKSFTLDPEIGGELNIARCYEEWGKLGRALTAYRKAKDMADHANDDRAPKIQDRIAQLEPTVPKLTIKAPPGVDVHALAVRLDDTAISDDDLGKPQAVDPGPHEIKYQADGGEKKKTVAIERGATQEVVLELGPAKPAHHDGGAVGGEHGEAPSPGRTYRIAGIATAGAGALAVVISGVVGLSARSKYQNSLKNDCMGMTNMCDPAGLTATHDARHEANIATAVFVLGVAAIGGGAALYFLAPQDGASGEHALRLEPSLTRDGAGIALGGRL